MTEQTVLGTTEWEMTYPQLRFIKVCRLFRRLSKDIYPRTLLDIGCGNGTVSTKIKNVLRLDKVDGVDLLADSIKVPDWLDVQQLDIDKEDLPYLNESFGAVYCGELVEHLVDTDHLLEEVHRVLAPSGKCVITTPNLASWPNRMLLPLGFQPFSTSVSMKYEQSGKFKLVGVQGHRGHLRVFTTRALLELLRLHDFKVDRIEGWEIGDLSIHLHSSLLGRIVKPIDWFFARFPSLASRVAVVVRKN